MAYLIKLADGTELKNITLNGDTFESDIPIEDSVFENNLTKVEITDTETNETTVLKDARLLLNRPFGNTWWFVIQELPEQDRKMEQTARDITDIQEAIAELYELIIGSEA